MYETSKAEKRRKREQSFWTPDGVRQYHWDMVLRGRVLDVGSGDDLLSNAEPFDLDQGDANDLRPYYEERSFDAVHASQCLEHMHNPTLTLATWLHVVKPGGFVVVTIPDFDLYEKRRWPSRFNPDHRAAFSLWRQSAPSAPLIHVPTMLRQYNVRRLALLDTHYDYMESDDVDQTLDSHNGVEAFIEFVVQK
jgi:SAM-dependent methyltransferase